MPSLSWPVRLKNKSANLGELMESAKKYWKRAVFKTEKNL